MSTVSHNLTRFITINKDTNRQELHKRIDNLIMDILKLTSAKEDILLTLDIKKIALTQDSKKLDTISAKEQ